MAVEKEYRFEGPNGPASLVDLFDGSRSVAEIAVEQLSRSGELELSGVAELADLLYSGGFLIDRYIDTDEALAKALHPVRPRRAKLREFVRTLSIEWWGAERLVKFSSRAGLRWVFTRVGLVVAAVVAIGGFAAFGDVVANHGFHITAPTPNVRASSKSSMETVAAESIFTAWAMLPQK